MSIKVKNDTFYVLLLEDDKWIYENDEEAIASLKEKASSQADINLEKTRIAEITIGKEEEEQWQIKEVPWSRIAMTLIKEEE